MAEQMPCYVYFIGQSESPYIKIGISNDVWARLGQLQVGNPDVLICLRVIKMESQEAAKALEAIFHKRYAKFRVQGEWYHLDAVDLIGDINFALEMMLLFDSISGPSDIIDFPFENMPEVSLVDWDSETIWQRDGDRRSTLRITARTLREVFKEHYEARKGKTLEEDQVEQRKQRAGNGFAPPAIEFRRYQRPVLTKTDKQEIDKDA